MVTLDYHLPDYTGDQILSEILSFKADLPVLIVSSQEDVLTALDLLKNGAYDYIVKSNDIVKRLRKIINNVQDTVLLQRKVELLEQELSNKYVFSNLIRGKSPAMIHVFKLMQKSVLQEKREQEKSWLLRLFISIHLEKKDHLLL